MAYFFFPNEAILLLFKMHLAVENGCSAPLIACVSAVQKNNVRESTSDGFVIGGETPSQWEARNTAFQVRALPGDFHGSFYNPTN